MQSLSTAYLGFDNTTKPFNDKNVRLAFNIGVDRDYLINNWLQGDGYPCENGFVPSMLEFNASKVKGYSYDATKAKQLLAQAGYPNGANFPTLTAYINTTKGSVVHKLAQGVQAQLKKNLNVSITIQLCSITERDQAIKQGKAKLWRGGWIADYPDPENFLNLFYGKNILANTVISNPFKYKSADFDTNFEAAMKEKEESKRSELFVKCDQQVVDDAPILLLYHQDFMTMINSRIRNFDSNPTEIIDFSKIYIREKKVVL
jgi:peptide/nickel transport system substrate-binding protein